MAEANVVNADAVVEQKRAALEQANVDLGRTGNPLADRRALFIKREVNPGQTTVAVTLAADAVPDRQGFTRDGGARPYRRGRRRPLAFGQTATLPSMHSRSHLYGQGPANPQSAGGGAERRDHAAIVSAPNPELVLMPGMTANLRIVVSDTGDVLKIPNQALYPAVVRCLRQRRRKGT